jgi:CRP/FNR family transcriptional regulator, cyclic AMP receptor protein
MPTASRQPNLYTRLVAALRPGKPGHPDVWVVPETRWSQLLSHEDMAVMGGICPPRPYRKGERIYRQGDPADSLFIVLNGSLKVAMIGASGRERVVAVLGGDDFFGESFLTGNQTRQSEATCLSETAVVCPISREQFLAVSARLPAVAVHFATVLAERMQVLERQLEQLTLPAPVRLGRALLMLATRFGRAADGQRVALTLNLTHEELASLAATTRVSTTQAFSQWRSLGLVEGTRGDYSIDTEALRAWVEALEAEQ